ncbi:SMI1/KNR4 family protein [Chryseobacterium sp. PBS4-4]|uniref:SMI1/KNR4 family protein n=1 Tax=Chryseobacterium edaphi TaxID=2976532 RepID=A0ABT2W1P4_9FLAO|nr:SMI1/KNR4 family protein [Chryseobacterium edaphi]MCU7616116.1 SMI1/KNR4 family protein [Chryseobacterium edaphi]
MKEILLAISLLSIQLGDAYENASTFQIQKKWLGFRAAKSKEISETEKRLNIKLPEDYKTFLKITNGFSASSTLKPTFMEIESVDFLKNFDTIIINAWKDAGDFETANILERSILIAGKDQEQYFLLIPPNDENGKWRYWKFASWQAGENEFENLDSYFKNVLKFYEKENTQTIN